MKMVYIAPQPREFPGIGVFQKGDKIDYDESLYQTGFFEKESKKKEGDK